MRQKTLCINLGYGGGCVYYANNLIKYLTVRKEVWISRYSEEPYENADRKLCVAGGLRSMLWQTLFVLPWYLAPTIGTAFFFSYFAYGEKKHIMWYMTGLCMQARKIGCTNC